MGETVVLPAGRAQYPDWNGPPSHTPKPLTVWGAFAFVFAILNPFRALFDLLGLFLVCVGSIWPVWVLWGLWRLLCVDSVFALRFALFWSA